MWQAGLLCLLATAQAVVVHQSPVYDSLDANKLQPRTVYKTALNPQPIYSHPQATYSQPQTTYSQPQVTYSQPQTTYSQPQITYSQPQTTYSQSQVTYSQPQGTSQPQIYYSQPQTTYSKPQVSHSQPQTTYTQPQNRYYPQQLLNQQPVDNHLQPTPSNQKDDYYDEPSYSFTYQIHDDLTGDQKSHSETRQGDVVQGSYSLIEPDGSRRIVDYIADKIGGFRAQVRREKGAAKPIVAVKTPVAVYQPVQPVVQNYIPRHTQHPTYQNGPVTFTPAKYLNSQLQPAPVTEQAKYTTYSPVVYASAPNEEKTRTAAPGTFRNPNQTPYKPVQYA